LNNLTERVIDAIKDNLGELEIEAINDLLKDRDSLVRANETIEMLKKDLAEAKKTHQTLMIDLEKNQVINNKLSKEKKTLEGEIERYQEREVELRVSEALIPLHKNYSDRAFNILDNSLRYYTQKTTRSVVMDGGETPSGIYDNNGAPVMQKLGEVTNEVTDTKTIE